MGVLMRVVTLVMALIRGLFIAGKTLLRLVLIEKKPRKGLSGGKEERHFN